MYSTCIFCSTSLGSNETIEEFPVGRRVAYNQRDGRLWVVCAKCSRWNLSPFDSRWEAIESAERAFRETRVRVSTENVGLARLRDGTELVRIGKPLRPEFAAWRYGDLMASRRRKYVLWGVATLAASLTPLVGVLEGLSILGSACSLAWSVSQRTHLWWRKNVPHAAVVDSDGITRLLTQSNLAMIRLYGYRDKPDWRLELPYMEAVPSGVLLRTLGHRFKRDKTCDHSVMLTGASAMRALATALPHMNRAGAKPAEVEKALATIDAAKDTAGLMLLAANDSELSREYLKWQFHQDSTKHKNVAVRPTHLRLALEMSLHESDERRAMEGELRELEARWRDADAIAQIADGMLLPEHIERRMDKLRMDRT